MDILDSPREVYLIKHVYDSLAGSKLPSNGQIIGRLYFLHFIENSSVQDSVSTTADELMTFWQAAAIPTKLKKDVINKLKKYYQEWVSLNNHRERTTTAHLNKAKAFENEQDNLFDIAISNAMQI